ncbi:lmo0937 family membrane protein [Lacinutrix undariae]
MSKILTVLAFFLLGIWAVSFFIYDLSFIAHLFLVLATLAFIIKVLKEK